MERNEGVKGENIMKILGQKKWSSERAARKPSNSENGVRIKEK